MSVNTSDLFWMTQDNFSGSFDCDKYDCKFQPKKIWGITVYCANCMYCKHNISKEDFYEVEGCNAKE